MIKLTPVSPESPLLLSLPAEDVFAERGQGRTYPSETGGFYRSVDAKPFVRSYHQSGRGASVSGTFTPASRRNRPCGPFIRVANSRSTSRLMLSENSW